jgi:hypothetical protein
MIKSYLQAETKPETVPRVLTEELMKNDLERGMAILRLELCKKLDLLSVAE